MSLSMILPYFFISVIAIVFGQAVAHLNKKLPPVVAEEITYKEFFASLKKDFKIDLKYTAIFLVLFNLFVYYLGSNITTYLYTILSFSLAIVFSVDARFSLIPDECHVIIVFAALINFIFNILNWWSYLLGGLVGGLIFWLLGQISLLLLKKEGMGFGDVKLMAALGLFFGLKNILVITLISFVFGAIIGGTLLVVKKDIDGYIPFGPFIVIGALIMMFVPADVVINIYIVFCSWLGEKMNDGVFWVLKKLGAI